MTTSRRLTALSWLVAVLLAGAAGAPAPAADVNDLHDITDIEQVPPRPPESHWLLWTVGSVAVGLPVLAGLTWLGVSLFRNRRRPTLLPPDRWALRELERLEAAAENAPAMYHTQLSNVVRRYVELRFGFPALERTTAETLRTFHESEEASGAWQGLLEDVLRRCDLAKFAGLEGTAEERVAAVGLARRFVEESARPVAPAAKA